MRSEKMTVAKGEHIERKEKRKEKKRKEKRRSHSRQPELDVIKLTTEPQMFSLCKLFPKGIPEPQMFVLC